MRRHPTALLTRVNSVGTGTVVPAPKTPAAQNERTNRGRRLLQSGSLTGAPAPGAQAARMVSRCETRTASDRGTTCLGSRLRLISSVPLRASDLVMAPGPSASFVFDSKLTDYAAVDVNVLISFTRNSLLIKRRQVRHCLLSWLLQHAQHCRHVVLLEQAMHSDWGPVWPRLQHNSC